MKRWMIATGVLFATTVSAADLPASLSWSQRVELAPTVSGVVETVLVEAGQRVAAGTVLLRLNPTLYQARLAEAEAERNRMRAEAQDADTDLARAKELYARTVSSTTELAAVQLRHARVTAQLAAAEARLAVAARQLAETEIRAPFAARVLERRAEPGMAAPANCQPPVLLVLAHAEQRSVNATVSAAQAAGLQPGDALTVMIAGKAEAARVRAVTALSDGSYRLESAVSSVRLPGETGVSVRLP